jgi:dienelactone hydrolase
MPGSAGWREFYPQLAHALADSGFAALALDYYGDTGLDTSSADAAMKRPVWRASIRNAVAHLAASASAGRAVALMGFSRGGFLAIEVGASLPAVKAVVEYFGGGATDPDSLRQQIRGHPPLLILHGDADTVVPVTHAYRLRDAVLAQGGVVEVQIYPGANHGSTTPRRP